MERKIFGIFFLIILYALTYGASITVTSPKTGDIWCINQTYDITWIKSGEMGENVRIRLLNHPSLTVALPIVNSTPTDDESYSWTIPDTVAPGFYRMRVRTTPDAAVWGDGEVFEIKECEMLLTPTEPQSVKIRKADLFVKKLTVSPKSPTVLDSIPLIFVIQNQGKNRIEDTQAKLEIKRNDGTIIRERIIDVFALDPNKTFSARLVINKIIKPGNYSFEIRANAGNIPGESNYNNNLKGVLVTVLGLPDLIVCGRHYYIRRYVKQKMIALVKNIGSERSGPCKLSYYIRDMGTSLIDIPALDPGKVFSVERHERWNIMDLLGVYKVVLKIDPDNEIIELKENNNRIETSVVVDRGTKKYQPSAWKCTDGSWIPSAKGN